MINWRKSSRSDRGDDCVELSTNTAARHIRDSKRPQDPALTFNVAELGSLLAAVKAGKYNL